MEWWKKFKSRLRLLRKRSQLERDLNDELAFHLAMREEQLSERGRTDTRATSRRQFGNLTSHLEDCREIWSFGAIERFLADLRTAVRRLASTPGFTVATITILALGIGANSALFTAIDRTVLRPLPFSNPDRLVVLWEDFSAFGSPKNRVAPATFIDWRKRAQGFEFMGAYGFRYRNLSEGGPPEQVVGLGVSAALIPGLGIQPLLGRTITEAEDSPGTKVVVLSYRLWQRRFNGDPNIIGQLITMSDEKYSVIGVMPMGFQFPNRETEYWIPLGLTPELLARRNSHFLNVIARLKPDRSIQQAQKELDSVAADLAREYPASNKQIGIKAIRLQDEFVQDGGHTFLILLCAASCVLLIACANVANLLLARSPVRVQEAAIRSALGASSLRILAQILTENVLLAIAGGACALLVGKAIATGLQSMIPPNLVGLVDLNLDWRTIGFTSVIAIGSGLLFGMGPAVQLSRSALAESLKGASKGNVGGKSGRVRDALVIAEIAVALVLVTGALLLVQTLTRLHALDAGFSSEGILTASVNVPLPKYEDAGRRQRFYTDLVDKANSIPGVKASGLTSDLPYTSRGNTQSIAIEGRLLPNVGVNVLFRLVSAGYLETMGARLVDGRFLRWTDQMDTEPVVVVNETLARTYWPGESAIGHRIDTGTGDGKPKWMTIVGVVKDVRERGIDFENKIGVYVPFTQTTISFFMPSEIAVRTSREPLSLSRELQQAVWSLDPEQPVAGIATMESIVEGELSNRTQVLKLLAAFAGLALLLAAFGAYSVLSYVVSLRSREIGLRMAIGASRWDIARSMLLYSAKLASLGIVAGVLMGLAATRLLSSLLFGVSPADPSTFAVVSAGLFLVALLATLAPSIYAARIDPMTTLRNE